MRTREIFECAKKWFTDIAPPYVKTFSTNTRTKNKKHKKRDAWIVAELAKQGIKVLETEVFRTLAPFRGKNIGDSTVINGERISKKN